MRLLSGILVVVAVGCGVQEASVGSNEADPVAEGGELSATSRTYVALRQDMRRCVAPLCGGYFVHDLNRTTLEETYVSGLDFSSSGLSEADQSRVFSGIGEVVLRGKLGPKEPRFNTRPFIVSEAYRGLPGMTVDAADSFYQLDEVNIRCVRAPCPSMSATRVNHTAAKLFHVFDIAGLGGNRLELKWLNQRALQDGAITSGQLVKSGDTTTLEPSNIFLKLPENAGPCPLVKIAACPSGQVRTYERSPDRCVLPSACVTPGVCAQFVPACDDGYSLQSWSGGQFACPTYVCDPSWLYE